MRWAYGILFCLIMTCTVSVSSASAQVQGKIERMGLFAGGQPMIRSGNYCFVEVKLRLASGSPFDGELRLSERDRDGDVTLSAQKVSLAPNNQWRSYEVYFTPNESSGTHQIRVHLYKKDGELAELVTDTGETVTELVVRDSPYYLPPDELLVVNITPKLPHAAFLSTQRYGAGYGAHRRTLRRMAPQELPKKPQGLQAVDAIIWDDADPSELQPEQVEALVGWVEAGGRLLLSASKNWQNLMRSDLGKVLPVTIEDVEMAEEVGEFLPIVITDSNFQKLQKHYRKHPITRCKMRARKSAIPIPSKDALEPIAYRQFIGRGSLTFVGASLAELLPMPSRLQTPDPSGELSQEDNQFIQMCVKVLGSNLLGLPQPRKEEHLFEPIDLFAKVCDTISFQTLSAAFLIFAILFAVAYTLSATLGSYWYLKRRGWEHLCWSAFAIVGLAGVLIGVGMVITLRGVTNKVMQTTIIDATAGQDYGYATCLFGVKTPDHTRLDLVLPVGIPDTLGNQVSGLLRPLPSSLEAGGLDSTFVAADTYRSEDHGTRLTDVPVRATLKELQGHWHGPLPGTIDARLVVPRREAGGEGWRFGKGSYIRNNLGTDLMDCWLIDTRGEIAGENGMTNKTYCYWVGTLKKSGEESELTAEEIAKQFYEKPGARKSDPPKELKPIDLTINKRIRQWKTSFTGVGWGSGQDTGQRKASQGQAQDALLMLSVFDLFEQESGQMRAGFRRSHGRSLDCTHLVTKQTAVLIGFSHDPPPALLQIDRSNQKPWKSLTMYRFVIPVERE